MKRPIFFRADADHKIGYGHFIRSLALADMLKNDFHCVFYTQTPTAFQKEQIEEVCQCVELPSDTIKFDLFLSCLKGNEIVVLDNYFNTTEYQQKIKDKGCVLICIDDLHKDHFVADAVINHSLGVSSADYSCESYTKLYFGLKYALLRKPFLDSIKTHNYKPVKNENLDVLVCFGGADKCRIAERLSHKLSTLDKIRSIKLLSVDGRMNEVDGKIQYLKNLSAAEMASLFKNSDLVIIPSSTIMKEALACGSIILGGYFAENQINSYNQFCNLDAIVGFGDLSKEENQNSLVDFISSNNMDKLNLKKNIFSASIEKNYLSIFNQYAGVSQI